MRAVQRGGDRGQRQADSASGLRSAAGQTGSDEVTAAALGLQWLRQETPRSAACRCAQWLAGASRPGASGDAVGTVSPDARQNPAPARTGHGLEVQHRHSLDGAWPCRAGSGRAGAETARSGQHLCQPAQDRAGLVTLPQESGGATDQQCGRASAAWFSDQEKAVVLQFFTRSGRGLRFLDRIFSTVQKLAILTCG